MNSQKTTTAGWTDFIDLILNRAKRPGAHISILKPDARFTYEEASTSPAKVSFDGFDASGRNTQPPLDNFTFHLHTQWSDVPLSLPHDWIQLCFPSM